MDESNLLATLTFKTGEGVIVVAKIKARYALLNH